MSDFDIILYILDKIFFGVGMFINSYIDGQGPKLIDLVFSFVRIKDLS